EGLLTAVVITTAVAPIITAATIHTIMAAARPSPLVSAGVMATQATTAMATVIRTATGIILTRPITTASIRRHIRPPLGTQPPDTATLPMTIISSWQFNDAWHGLVIIMAR